MSSRPFPLAGRGSPGGESARDGSSAATLGEELDDRLREAGVRESAHVVAAHDPQRGTWDGLGQRLRTQRERVVLAGQDQRRSGDAIERDDTTVDGMSLSDERLAVAAQSVSK